MQDLKKHIIRKAPRARTYRTGAPISLRRGKEGKHLIVYSQLRQHPSNSLASGKEKKPPSSKSRKEIRWTTLTKLLFRLSIFSFASWMFYGNLREANTFFQYPVKNIRINGNQLLSKKEVFQKMKLSPQMTLQEVDPYAVTVALQEHPVIHIAQVRKLYPDYLFIDLVEYSAYATLLHQKKLYLLDPEKRLLKEAEFGEISPGPVLTGLPQANVELGKAIQSYGLDQGYRFLVALKQLPGLIHHFATIDLTDSLNIQTKLKENDTIVKFGSDFFMERLQVFQEMYPFIDQKHPNAKMLDLRYRDKLAISP